MEALLLLPLQHLYSHLRVLQLALHITPTHTSHSTLLQLCPYPCVLSPKVLHLADHQRVVVHGRTALLLARHGAEARSRLCGGALRVRALLHRKRQSLENVHRLGWRWSASCRAGLLRILCLHKSTSDPLPPCLHHRRRLLRGKTRVRSHLLDCALQRFLLPWVGEGGLVLRNCGGGVAREVLTTQDLRFSTP